MVENFAGLTVTAANQFTNNPFTQTNNGAGGGGFGNLYDVVARRNPAHPGCLLVSDRSQGRIYSVDFTNLVNGTDPKITEVVRNLTNPRGLALDASDNLFVADDGLNAVLEIKPGDGVSGVTNYTCF